MLTNGLSLRTLLILATAGLVTGPTVTAAQAPYAPAQRITGPETNLREAWGLSNEPILRRATRLIGEPLKNTQGEKLGTIHDLVLAPDLSAVSYAVVSRRSMFSLSRRLYAIPWSAMQPGVGTSIVAPIDAREFEQDPGFNPKLWPAEGDPRWLNRAGQRTEQVTFDVQPAVRQKDIRSRRVSKILGMSARGRHNERIGKVKDMLVAMNSGGIPFTIVSYGGMFGVGDKYTAVPAGAIELRPAEHVALIQVNKQILQANAFNPRHFPNLADPIYSRRLYSAYNVNPRDADWTVLGYIPPQPPAQPQTGYAPLPQTALSGQSQTTPPGQPQSTIPAQPQATLPGQTQTAFPAQPQTAQPQTTFPAQPQTAFPTQPQTTIPGQPMQQTGQAPLVPGVQTPQSEVGRPARNEYLAIFTPDNLRTIEGVVTGVSSFQLAGTKTEWVQLQVRADDGSLVTVHLGPRAYVSEQDFYVAANDRVKVTGAQATAWRQPIILPITVTADGETITLRDQTGHPLWDKILPPPQAQQPEQPQDTQPAPQQQEQSTTPQPSNTPPAPQGNQ